MRRLALLLPALLAACASRAERPLPAYVQRTKEPPFRPPEPDAKNWDWIQLTSDEWLKGEVKYMRNHTLEIDSDELDDLTFAWRKVRVLKSPRRMTALLDNQATVTGPIAIQDRTVVVKEADGFVVFPLPNLVTIVPSGDSALAYWSGNLSLGVTVRSGNTDQVDASLGFTLRRRAPRTRLLFDYLGNFGEVNDEETVNNQRLTGRYDLFVSRRWYATPIAAEFYRDPFQNINARVTPAAGAGYHLYKKGLGQDVIDWDVSALFGYRHTEFSGGGGSDGTFAVALTTGVDWDVTENLELGLSYGVQIGIPELEDTNQNLTLKLEYDVVKDLELNVSLVWNFVGKPQADASGNVPEKNDLRLIFGVGWDF